MSKAKSFIAALFALLATAGSAFGQSSPGLTTGQVPTAGQWNSYFAAKQDVLGFSPLSRAGGTMTGPLITAPPTASVPGLRLPPGTAPSSPTNGDLWSTSSGLFVRINGVTIGPLSGGSASSFAGTSPITVSFPAGVVTYAFDFTVANTFSANQTVQGLTTTSPGWYSRITGDSVPRVSVGLNATDVPSLAFGPGSGARDAFIERVGAASFRFGAPDAASPVAQTISPQNVVTGTANTAGAAFTIGGSKGTGSGNGGALQFQVALPGSTGSTQNSLTSIANFSGATGALLWNTDNTYDLGATGATRPRDLFLGRNAVVGGTLSVTGHVTLEGVTSTGATGTQKIVFDTAPTISALVVTGSFTATGLVTNADLANASTTVNGQTCTLGSTCTITASATSITIGSTTIGSGTTTRILYNNANTLGEYTISGNGTVVAMAASPSFTTPTLGVAIGTSLALGGCTISTNALCATGTANISGATTIGGALTYGGVTLSNAVAGTGNMVLSAGPTFTGTITAAIANYSGALAANGSFTASADTYYTGTITPTALSGSVDNYNPTGLSTSSVIRLSGGAADRNITGLAGGAAGRSITIINIGTTNNLIFKNLSGSSTAANQFGLGADVTIAANGQSAKFWYDTTASLWRAEATYTTAGGIATGTVTSVTCATTTITTSGTCYARGQVVGTATNDDATAGNFGEYVVSSVESADATSISSASATNMTSISLTAGDWDVSLVLNFLPAATTAVIVVQGSVSATSATRDLTAPRVATNALAPTVGVVNSTGAATSIVIPSARFSLSTTTTIYAVGFAIFGTSTMTQYGTIHARRVR